MQHIDAHQHYWNPSRNDYGWLTPDQPVLYRTYGPSDLAGLRQGAGIGQTIVIQAAPTLEETRYLLGVARGEASIAGVVGWVPLLDPAAPALIAELALDTRFKGVRPMLQDLPDDNWINNPALVPAIEALIAHDLAFDALIFAQHAAALAAFATRFPALRIVIDHGAKPPIRAGGMERYAWAEALNRFAPLPQVYCKLSGLATEAAPGWTDATLRPYVEHLLTVFGPARLMWGSDWPVLNLNGDYLRWHGSARTLLAALPEQERDAIFGGNARIFYRL
ncbi:amidohydrolase family protein [Paraburkholderia bonniea]|uniref:amidohydrolase family protein n=1 Tax=Paraburkholderia bonniea TaxID=2152891 RepID=UPI0012923B36|nr:amidohydrolase family protein [Paraburkholderia bonniea]WJF91798.1 amidohydrolase family protein [Paraburkholderia bonniea]WJF95117.1 amidohydrolase family protein [Paraburkholderia bonniea]